MQIDIEKAKNSNVSIKRAQLSSQLHTKEHTTAPRFFIGKFKNTYRPQNKVTPKLVCSAHVCCNRCVFYVTTFSMFELTGIFPGEMTKVSDSHSPALSNNVESLLAE